MPSREFVERSWNIPYDRWKEYAVPIKGGFGKYYRVWAPNKTMARRFAEGEINPWCKVRGKVIEIPEKDWALTSSRYYRDQRIKEEVT